ncbi:MAG: CoB--CoM heterodisulfide reductase iron-sulfur subunit B family protein [Candidatus Bathyarchaeia archaeon]
MRFAYFPGCASRTTATEYDASTRALCQRLGIELVDMEDASCCGLSITESVSHDLWVSLLARNLSLAEQKGLDLISTCSICSLNLSKAEDRLRGDPETRSRVNDILSKFGLKYTGEAKVRHLIDVIVHDIGFDALKEKMVRPLNGLKAAPFYGCQLIRPPEITRFDNPERPHLFDDLINAVGAESVDYVYKTKCCGGVLYLIDVELAQSLAKECLLDAKYSGADCMVTACPICHYMLDAHQLNIEKNNATRIDLPVLHFTQLLGLALGISPDDLKLTQNCVATEGILRSLGY